VSSLGDGVTYAALPLLALTLTRDPMALAVITAAGTLPWLLFGVLGGALVDRWDRRRTMWVTDAARAVLLAIPAAAAALDVLSIALLAAVAFLLALGGLFFDTAATVYLPDLLGRDPAQLERANTRLRGTQTAGSGFAGPPAGSALLALGRPVPLLTDAVSFALSALLVRSLPAVPRPEPEVRESLLRQARAGASYVFRDRVLLGLALRPAVGTSPSSPWRPSLPSSPANVSASAPSASACSSPRRPPAACSARVSLPSSAGAWAPAPR
jgi:MFS family permease